MAVPYLIELPRLLIDAPSAPTRRPLQQSSTSEASESDCRDNVDGGDKCSPEYSIS